ncbi:hypothetical protein Nepgr_016878 [Nepenthes gracilis]|uniref:Pentatricopeptide repeat-containing protein n=1 Tax=Nepenthes gracilis TaxID=150966 RepID=A0AAD3SQ46_NEPGR|nr:hypothetical protein Nepgr_016878 [Nepenthes gracilis]
MLAPKPSFSVRYLSPLLAAALSQPLQKPPSLSALADKCTSMRQLKQVHAQMIVASRIHDNYAASRLLSFCALSDSGDVNYAVKLFNTTHEPNTFMWNTMIRAQAGGLNPSAALFLYTEMRRLDVWPGKHTFPFVLKACTRFQSLNCCKQVHTHVMKFGLESDLHVVNGLVRGYSVSGELSDARQVFDEISERNLSVWTSMVCGYAQNDFSNEALLLFDGMVADGFEPNGATLASVLSASAKEGCLELGDAIYEFTKERGIELGVILGTALVHMYAKNGAVSKARVLFDSMQEKNIATWNAMIHGLAVHGHGEEALRLFQKLEKENVIPNDITFIGVLSACCHAGLLEAGREIFHSMKTVHNIQHKIEHYGCMVNLLGRGGKLLEAEKLIRDMVWKADVVIWGALLTACRNRGNIEVAERVVEEIRALDPHNHGVHVVLSNMYAEAGRWEDVMRLRKSMKKGNLKKVPGWSSVDDGG